MKRKHIIFGFIILLILVFLALFPYLFIFSTVRFSKNPSDWTNAATWFSLFISILTTVLLIYLTWKIHKNEESREAENRLFLKSLERPLVICKSIRDKPIEKWGVTNVGKAAALNLRINYKENRNGDWQPKNTKCYSLIPNVRFELDWIKYVNIICVFYEDVFGNKYVTIGVEDESYQQPFDGMFKTIKINEDLSFSYEGIKKIFQKPTQRLYEAQQNKPDTLDNHGTSGGSGIS